MGTIYISTNLVNQKQYVGQTTRNLQERKNNHKKFSYYFGAALKKYGLENFKWIHFDCAIEELDWVETFLIKELKTLAPNGYNCETGGNKQKVMSKSSRKKMSKAKKGTIMSEESRKKMSERRKGVKFSEEHKLHIAESKMGEKNPMFGNTHSKEVRQKLSEFNKNKILSNEHRDKIAKTLIGHSVSEETRQKISETLKA
ncbi:MAG: NUMOD3 domain-containing DNA-binding protein, partial [Patescibacteria group bacterium]